MFPVQFVNSTMKPTTERGLKEDLKRFQHKIQLNRYIYKHILAQSHANEHACLCTSWKHTHNHRCIYSYTL